MILQPHPRCFCHAHCRRFWRRRQGVCGCHSTEHAQDIKRKDNAPLKEACEKALGHLYCVSPIVSSLLPAAVNEELKDHGQAADTQVYAQSLPSCFLRIRSVLTVAVQVNSNTPMPPPQPQDGHVSAEKYFTPFRLACESKSSRIVGCLRLQHFDLFL